MRTFPKQLATLRRIVNERGEKLRTFSWEQILALADKPTEQIEIESRSATISVIVEAEGYEILRVVIQGRLKHKFFPGYSLDTDGFYKHRNGDVTPMADEEFYRYD